MDTIYLDFRKYGIEYIENKKYCELTDEDIRKLTDAYASEDISPYVPDIELNMENVTILLSLSKCQKCGKCCTLNKKALYNPGIMVSEDDLNNISRHTKHSVKSLKKMTRINRDTQYAVGERYLPLPCMFLDKTNNKCKIYTNRPFVCSIYPVSFADNGYITIDLQCKYGKEIFQKTIKQIVEIDKQGEIK